MLRICSSLFDLWNSDVRYCHWKSNEHLLEGLEGKTDLDVFVIPEDQAKAEDHLRSCKYIKFRPQKSSQYPMVDEWIGFDEDTGALVHIHLHYQIITGTKFCKEYSFPVNKEIIESRILHEETNVYISSPEIEIIILFARIVLKSKNKNLISPKGYEKEIDYLKSNLDKSKLDYYCNSLIGKDGKLYYNIILKDAKSQKDWQQLRTIIRHWLDPYRRMTAPQSFFRSNFYWIKLYVDLVREKLLNEPLLTKKTFPHSKVSICFIGQDGCGKSTLSGEIEKWLRWKIEAHRFYLGSGEHYKSPLKGLLRLISSFRKKIHPSPLNDKVTEVHSHKVTKTDDKRAKGISGFFLMLATSYELKNIAKRAYKQILKANNYSDNGGVSIFDRFPQNQFGGIYDGPKIRSIYIENGHGNWFVRFMARKEEHYINRIQEFPPTIVFKLLLSPEESIKRKPFENYEQVRQKHIITQKIVFPRSETFYIDATQDYAQELLIVKNRIWRCFLKNQSL